MPVDLTKDRWRGRPCPPYELCRVPSYRGAGTISLTLFLPAFFGRELSNTIRQTTSCNFLRPIRINELPGGTRRRGDRLFAVSKFTFRFPKVVDPERTSKPPSTLILWLSSFIESITLTSICDR